VTFPILVYLISAPHFGKTFSRSRLNLLGWTSLTLGMDLPSGSDHSKSHIGPSCGTSCFLSITRICHQLHRQYAFELRPYALTYLIKPSNLRTQPPMNTENPSIHNSSQSQIIKDITTISPYIPRSIFPLTFIVESIYLGDLAGFVVPSNEGYTVWIADF
jgi:hypothetical protein